MIRQGTFLGIILLALAVGSHAEAKPAVKHSAGVQKKFKIARKLQLPRLLTSRQLASLNPKKRAGYLKGIRKALVQMEAMQQKMHDGTKRASLTDQFTELFAQLNVLDQAYGAVSSPDIPSVTKSAAGWNITCGSGHSYDYMINICVKNRLNDGNCPSGSIIGHYRITEGFMTASPAEVCIPTSQFEQFDRTTQDTLLSQENFGLNAADGSGFPRKGVQVFKTRADVAAAIDSSLYKPSIREAIMSSAPAEQQPQPGLNQVTLPAATTPAKPTKAAIAASIVATLKANGAGKPVIPVLREGRWDCSNNDDKNHIFFADFGTCVRVGQPCTGAQEGVSVSFMNQAYCIPSASFLAMSADRRELICAQPGVTATSVNCSPQAAGLRLDGTDKASVDQILGGLPESDRKAIIFGGQSAVAGGPATNIDYIGQVKPDERIALSPVLEPAAVPGAVLEAAGGQCEWKGIDGTACADNPSGTKAARLAFRRAHDENFAGASQNFSICLFSGNFSTYKDGKAMSGQCNPVRSLAGTNLNCSSPKVLCNPFVFGVESGGTALCVDGKGQSTKECAAKAKDAYTAPEGLSGAGWDQFAAQFKTNFEKYCLPGKAMEPFTGVFQGYFCHECNAIGQTIADNNKEYARDLGLCAAAAAEDPAGTNTAPAGDDGKATSEVPAIFE